MSKSGTTVASNPGRRWRPLSFAAVLLLAAACGSAGGGNPSSTGQPGPGAVSGARTSGPDAAEIVAANHEADQSLHILARVFTSSGSVFEFYQPQPGLILLSEAGPAGAALHRDLIRMPAVEIFHRLSPGKAVPKALLDAVAQARTTSSTSAVEPAPEVQAPVVVPNSTGAGAAAKGGATPGVRQDPGVGADPSVSPCGSPPSNNGYCSPTWFKNNLCTNISYYGSLRWNWCLYNWWNGAYEQDGSDSDDGYGAVCASINSVVMKLSADYGGGQWSVPQGTYRWATPGTDSSCFFSVLCDQNVRYDITNASGSEFHFCGDFADWD